MATIIQKSKEMEDIYSVDDPWSNKARGLYNVLGKRMLDEVIKYLKYPEFTWCDIGCGGGNLFDGITYCAKSTELCNWKFTGVDSSQNAIDFLKKDPRYIDVVIQKMDMQDFKSTDDMTPIWSNADIISFVEVTYYYDRVDHRTAMTEFWKSLKPGQIVIVADSLIPYQYRDFLRTMSDSEMLSSYTDYSMPVSTNNINKSGKQWTRWLKVRIYRKK